jgi:hypothetical protein
VVAHGGEEAAGARWGRARERRSSPGGSRSQRRAQSVWEVTGVGGSAWAVAMRGGSLAASVVARGTVREAEAHL